VLVDPSLFAAWRQTAAVTSRLALMSQIDVGPWLEKQGNQVIADAIKIAEESTKQSGRAQINSELFFSATVPTLVNLNRAHARATTRPNNRK
jgi:hypothetical protein